MRDSAHPVPSSLAAVQDHSRTFSEFAFVYPVISRRSRGLSIGVNLNPDKACNFDCIYCEVDRTVPNRVTQLDLERLRSELAALLALAMSGGLAKFPKFDEVPDLTRFPRDIAFSGDGEPTLIENFSQAVAVVARVKKEADLQQTKIVLITDAAGLDKADVREGLKIMDAHQGEVWAKLDAGSELYYRQVNRSSVRFDRILANIQATAQARPIIVQSLFLRIDGQPMPIAECAAYCDRLNAFTSAGAQIKEVHAYTIARPVPDPSAQKLSPEELETIADQIRRRTNLPVSTFC